MRLQWPQGRVYFTLATNTGLYSLDPASFLLASSNGLIKTNQYISRAEQSLAHDITIVTNVHPIQLESHPLDANLRSSTPIYAPAGSDSHASFTGLAISPAAGDLVLNLTAFCRVGFSISALSSYVPHEGAANIEVTDAPHVRCVCQSAVWRGDNTDEGEAVRCTVSVRIGNKDKGERIAIQRTKAKHEYELVGRAAT